MSSLFRYKILKFFFWSDIRMSGKNISFENKKIKRNDFYKSKRLCNIDIIDLNQSLISKIELYRKKADSNTLLDILMMMMVMMMMMMMMTMMMLLEHYV